MNNKGRYILKCTIHTVGIGGWFCQCCRGGVRFKAKRYRALKRAERQRWIKEAYGDLAER